MQLTLHGKWWLFREAPQQGSDVFFRGSLAITVIYQLDRVQSIVTALNLGEGKAAVGYTLSTGYNLLIMLILVPLNPTQ